MTEHGRGSGRTAEQMRKAPKKAIFIWCNKHLNYPKLLARHLGREDLQIQGLSILDDSARRLHGLEPTGVVVDHAARLTDDQFEGLEYVVSRVR